MNIEYTTEKKFTKEDIQELFLSVGWVSGQYPNRLYKALMGSSTVLTAWNGEHLAGLEELLMIVSLWHLCTMFWLIQSIREMVLPEKW